MPNPRVDGYVAKRVLYELGQLVQDSMPSTNDIGYYTRAGNHEKAREAEQKVLNNQLLTLRVLTLFVSGDIAEAEKIVNEEKRKREK